jgi:hypothetical protein
MQGYLKLKAYGDFDAANRPSGWNTWITFAISTPAPGAPPTTKAIIRKYQGQAADLPDMTASGRR